MAVRRLAFELGTVNIISGASRTGKSAVIPIIDYCLGAGNCSIPVNTIRNACSWFGVVISGPTSEMLLARREPGAQIATDDMFILVENRIESVPETVEKNTTAPAARKMLDELAGLTNLDFSTSVEPAGFDARPSFRDMAAFTFQPQNVVANPDILFYKTSSYEHREKLRKIFPYVLGAVSPEHLAKQHELRRLQADLRRKERELASAIIVSDNWLAELQSGITEARELGLIGQEIDDELTREQMLSVLTRLVNQKEPAPNVTQVSVSEAIRELGDLETEESKVSRDLTALRGRLAEMERAKKATVAFGDGRSIQRERLSVSTWLSDHNDPTRPCPICGNALEPIAAGVLAELSARLRDFEDSAGIAAEVPAAFDREIQRVQRDFSLLLDQLKAVQKRKQRLSERSDEAKSSQFQTQKAERFLGNVENALQLQTQLGSDAGLSSELQELRESVARLAAELNINDVESRKERAVRSINLFAGRLLPNLDAEYPDAPMFLAIDDLNVRIERTKRSDLLSELGSGSNWLSYHIATALALHQFFLTLSHSAVPSFLVIDQPSQVYFPKRLVVRPGQEETEEIILKDEDVVAVKKVFSVVANVVANAGGKLQVIILDHAPKDVWGDVDGIHEVEEWRDGRHLVPMEWII
ncbi:MAG TPA: DUF3732 domain-containing protein [Fimbriimonadaceae bacterium]